MLDEASMVRNIRNPEAVQKIRACHDLFVKLLEPFMFRVRASVEQNSWGTTLFLQFMHHPQQTAPVWPSVFDQTAKFYRYDMSIELRQMEFIRDLDGYVRCEAANLLVKVMNERNPRPGRTDPAFEAELRERPNDSMVRLIYADWLEENGNIPLAKTMREEGNRMRAAQEAALAKHA